MTVPNSVAVMKMSARCISDEKECRSKFGRSGGFNRPKELHIVHKNLG